ncbi:MAG: Aminopeptidase [Bryobacterales bacterium]|nr:Aminopeptidase [Bryobacterales bacterium]
MKTSLVFTVLFAVLALPQTLPAQSKLSPVDKFRQLEEVLPTPNEYRTASGAPGHKYWQQRADYNIKVELDDENQRIIGSETINYHNLSPDILTYLWLQLDQNIFEPQSDANLTRAAPDFQKMPFATAAGFLRDPFEGGDKITAVRDAAGQPLPHTINKTMMRIDLKKPLAPGESVAFSVEWNYKINNSKKVPGRTGYEYFEKDQNYIYEIAQWFPRMAAYYDVYGWQHKQFLGAGEFTLEFGDYKVAITAPADHTVAATGVLQNPQQVLSKDQRARLERAKNAIKPVYIVTPDEALANEKTRAKEKKTWIFHAENVRDFAFASSRKFMWDAQQHSVEGNKVMAMSFFPKEGNPLWERYSTQAIMHTLDVYSRYSFDFPYPVAQSINGPVGGMEYPMICFNGPRPLDDKTYSARTKYGLISVVIHEVGHNFFPMVVNSDERQWTWMDEGLNSFLQYLAEQEWEKDYPSRRGEPKYITAYMTSTLQEPIMTNSDSILQLGNNAYAKTATGLNILRETVMGRELFDFAFKEYSRRWKFKRPTPADFFRTMQDASGVDLNWFWRGWFYSTDHTDISIENVKLYTIDTKNPDVEKPISRRLHEEEPVTLSAVRNQPLPKLTDAKPDLKDFYNAYDAFLVTEKDRQDYKKYVDALKPEERAQLAQGSNFYVVDLKNIGGLVMPVILAIDYADGTREELRIPAEIWRRNNVQVSKLIVTRKEIKQIVLDPHLETADTDLTNNYFPRRPVKTPFQLFKDEQEQKNPMQEMEHKSTTPMTAGVQ